MAWRNLKRRHTVQKGGQKKNRNIDITNRRNGRAEKKATTHIFQKYKRITIQQKQFPQTESIQLKDRKIRH